MKPINKDNINDSNTEFAKQMRGVLDNPKKFYYLLILSGYSGSEAQNLMFDLKYPKLRMASPTARKKVIKLLTTLINTITKDNMLYARFRNLAQHGIFEENGGGVTSVASVGQNIGLGVPNAQIDPPPVNRRNLIKYLLRNKNGSRRFDFINIMSLQRR